VWSDQSRHRSRWRLWFLSAVALFGGVVAGRKEKARLRVRFRVALDAALSLGVQSIVKAERTEGEAWAPSPTGRSVPNGRRR
jgi:hypothetical protein